MSQSRRGLLAAGLAAAVVGSMGVVWTLSANADETPDASRPAVVTETSEAAEPAEATEAITPADDAAAVPPKLLPWGAKPTRLKRAKAGANSAAVAAADADAAPADTSGRTTPVPEYAPKGRTSRTGSLKKGTTTVVPPAPPNVAKAAAANSVYYNYAKGNQTGETDGSWANLIVSKPTVVAGDYHSLAEISVQSGGENPNVVEVGWTVDRSVNGDNDPHLFVFYWKNGVPTCYNACGFKQYSPTVKPGDTLPVGDPKRFGIQHSGGNWWIAYNSEWIGYFPDALWDGAYTRAGFVQWFGEVASSTAVPCTAMGNGLLPSDPDAARIGSISMTNGPDAKVTLQPTTPHPTWYDVKWVTDKTFRFGGPGGSATDGC